ncbi:hypothetical protein Tco_1005206 [Tanacetum coccineum]|uniref:Uncharacterized protein n=1 Tax=Tanacetum coccineum TaxID=301880 RepID=A0ABQ5FF63_9ASTR
MTATRVCVFRADCLAWLDRFDERAGNRLFPCMIRRRCFKDIALVEAGSFLDLFQRRVLDHHLPRLEVDERYIGQRLPGMEESCFSIFIWLGLVDDLGCAEKDGSTLAEYREYQIHRIDLLRIFVLILDMKSLQQKICLINLLLIVHTPQIGLEKDEDCLRMVLPMRLLLMIAANDSRVDAVY